MRSLKRVLVLILFNLLVAMLVVLSAGKGEYVSQEDYGVGVWRSKNCTACHAVFGLGGHLGPDLTNVYENMGEEYISNVLKNGLRNMPDLKLSESEIKELIMYLKHVNSQGEYPLKSLNANPFGEPRKSNDQQ